MKFFKEALKKTFFDIIGFLVLCLIMFLIVAIGLFYVWFICTYLIFGIALTSGTVIGIWFAVNYINIKRHEALK